MYTHSTVICVYFPSGCGSCPQTQVEHTEALVGGVVGGFVGGVLLTAALGAIIFAVCLQRMKLVHIRNLKL